MQVSKILCISSLFMHPTFKLVCISLIVMPAILIIGACRIHEDVERAERIGKIIKELDPNHIGCRALLSNVYSASGRWKEARTLREKFLVGDRSHPQTKQIYLLLDEMGTKLKTVGYVPEVSEVLLDIDDEEDKKTALSRQSEKLAVAYGIMNTPPGATIRIVKNLRVCGDCHQATKFISNRYRPVDLRTNIGTTTFYTC
ncbi:hypothetical protein CRG98_018530 [Punica granatum]|uniref:DYW domain-containing protein n=1 Tax=Punica granatum TaxID=22663 RepID=A0A2I0JXS4_PUNGR|nr:hypothetical protein CRG98_018530 [Punica granatum]